ELIDGSLLYVREAIFPHTSKYSYYWQTARERCSCAGITLPIILKSPPIRITGTTGSAQVLRRGCRSKMYWPNWLPGCKAKENLTRHRCQRQNRGGTSHAQR